MTQDTRQNRGWHFAPFYRRNGLGIRSSLVSAVLGDEQATPKAKAPERKRGSPATKDDDNVLLEVRRLREQQGMSPGRIAAHLTSIGYPMNEPRARQIAEYYTRGHLVPTPGAEPYLQPKDPK